MLNLKKSAVLAGLGLVLATSAFAAPNSPYFRVDAGYLTNNSGNILDNTNLVTAAQKTNAEMKKGKFGFGFGAGYQFDNNLRADITFSMLGKNKIVPTAAAITAAKAAATPVDLTGTQASQRINLLMANIYYDFAGMNDSIVPYVTAGLGFGMLSSLDVDAKLLSAAAIQALPTNFTTSKNKLAYSLGLGISSKLNDNLALDVGYKFTQVRTKGSTSTVTTGDYLGFNYNNNAFMVGLRVSM